MSINTDQKLIDQLLSRGVNEVIDRENLKMKLLSGKKLRVKLGIDPTSPNLHLGRAVSLLKLKDFQDLGHQVVFIVGDFTGTIGDSSDKDAERPMLAEKTVKENMKSYVKQIGKLLDLKKVEVEYNSRWLKKLGFAQIGQQANQFSLAEFMARENIKLRYQAGKRISLRELLYPLMQGYDSVAIKADVEVGGTDQRFNLLAGRTLQSYYGQVPQDILMTNLILGTDGRKMSSSWGNTINLTDQPNEMFGKVMSLPDNLIIEYFIHCTRRPLEKINQFSKSLTENSINPKEIKQDLAWEIVKMYWGEKLAGAAKDYFTKVFTNKDLPDDLAEFKLAGRKIVEILVITRLASSNSEARRLIEEKAVKVNSQLVESLDFKVPVASIVQKGKRHFVKIV